MFKLVMIIPIRFVSLFFRALGYRACRFEPTCSEYAVRAFESMGFFKALGLSAKRFCRCHPLTAGGYDPLPALKRNSQG